MENTNHFFSIFLSFFLSFFVSAFFQALIAFISIDRTLVSCMLIIIVHILYTLCMLICSSKVIVLLLLLLIAISPDSVSIRTHFLTISTFDHRTFRYTVKNGNLNYKYDTIHIFGRLTQGSLTFVMVFFTGEF